MEANDAPFTPSICQCSILTVSEAQVREIEKGQNRHGSQLVVLEIEP